MTLTADAAHELTRAGFSRRAFLKQSGALVVGFSIADRLGPIGDGARLFAQAPVDPRTRLDSWIAIAGDGTVTAYAG